MKIAFGCDHAGVDLRDAVLTAIAELGHEVKDFGTTTRASVDYPDYGERVAKSVRAGECHLGIVVCGSGVGISIAANKVPGVRAALCTDPYTARMSRAHNDANVLAMGARVVGSGLAQEIVTTFLQASYEGGRHQSRVDKLTALDEV